MSAENRARLSRIGRRVTAGAGATCHGQTSRPCVLNVIKASLCVAEYSRRLLGGVCKAEHSQCSGEAVFVKRYAVNPPSSASQRLKSTVGIVKAAVINWDRMGFHPIDPGTRRTANNVQSNWLKMSEPFVPPNPKELDNA